MTRAELVELATEILEQDRQLPGAKTRAERLVAAFDARGALRLEVVHRYPPDDAAVMPCCGLSPFEVPDHDRVTRDPELVTCTVPDPSAVATG